MNDERKSLLIDQLRMCQSNIEKTLFNHRVAAKAKIDNELLDAFNRSIISNEETIEKLNRVIEGLQSNQNPDLDFLSTNIIKMVENSLIEERQSIEFIQQLFNQGDKER